MASTGEAWRLGRRPALDGLRGVAVLLVVLFHTGFAPFLHDAGSAGVTMFFVLSGFLVTALLVEQADCGRLSARTFLARRARRLIPALLAFLGAMLALAQVRPQVVGSSSLPWSALYLANWPMSFGANFEGVTHLWTLAIEGQFYLACALVAVPVLRRWGRRGLGTLFAAGVAASLVARFLLADGPFIRVYCGSDTNAFALLAGGLLAVSMTSRARSLGRWTWALAGVGLAALCLPTLSVSAPVGVAAVSVLMVREVAVDAVPSWLSARWLVLIGRRSYGLYLWHLPLFWLAGQMVTPRVPTTIVALAVAWGLTLLSWRYVEAPLASGQRQDVRPDRVVGGRGVHRVETSVGEPVAT